jgi:hypothetical protein
VQHDLPPLMQQNAERSAQEKERDIFGARFRFRGKHDLGAVAQ